MFNPTTGERLDIIDPATGQPKCFQQLENVIDTQSGGLRRYIFDPTVTAATGTPFFDGPGFRRVGVAYSTFLALANGNVSVADANWRANNALVPSANLRQRRRTAISPVERMTVYASGDFQLNDAVELFGELLVNRRESEQLSTRQLFQSVQDGPTNPIAALGAAARIARPIAMVNFDGGQTVDFTRAVVGLRGEGLDLPFLSNARWEVYAQLNTSRGEYYSDVIVQSRLFASLGINAAGVFTGYCPAGSYAGCVPFTEYFSASFVRDGIIPAALVGPGRPFDREVGTTDYDQTLISGSISGDVFDLPAGPVALALGFEWRQEEIDDIPGPSSRASDQWGLTSAGRTTGQDTVQEVFTEIEVPLLANVPFFESLTFNGSYRWTEYDSYGKNETYKVGLNWQITPEFRMRGTTGTSYRAPALYELFLANQTSFIGQGTVDPCINWDDNPNPIIRANCQRDGLPIDWANNNSSATVLTGGGGIGVLRPETSKADTFGIIWTPTNLPVSLALDYFKIRIEDQVAQFGAAAIVGACYADPNFPAAGFCRLFTRQTTPGSVNFGQITLINNSYVNLNSQETDGLDLSLRVRQEMSFGTFQWDLQATWTFSDTVELFAGDIRDNNGLVGEPDFTAQSTLRFDRGDWTTFWSANIFGRGSNDEFFGGSVFTWRGRQPAYYKQFAEFTVLHTVSVRYRGDNFEIRGGIQNLFDEPPVVASGGFGGARIGDAVLTSQSDLRGRTVFISASRSF